MPNLQGMPELKTPMRKKEIEAAEYATKSRICKSCGSEYRLGDRKQGVTLCDRCNEERKTAGAHRKNLRNRLALKGVDVSGGAQVALSEFEVEAEARANDLLAAYVSTMRAYGQQSNETLMTIKPPELEIAEHDINNEFTVPLKRIFLNLYAKMPRQDLLILEHLGISEKRYKLDVKKYPEFKEAIDQCDRKHLRLLEIVSFHNALNPKATSERIFLMKAGDPARYRESYKGDIFNMGQVNIQVSSNIKGLGIPKNQIAGGKSGG